MMVLIIIIINILITIIFTPIIILFSEKFIELFFVIASEQHLNYEKKMKITKKSLITISLIYLYYRTFFIFITHQAA